MKKFCILVISLLVSVMLAGVVSSTIGAICELTECDRTIQYTCKESQLCHYPKEICKTSTNPLLPIDRCADGKTEEQCEDCPEGKICIDRLPECVYNGKGCTSDITCEEKVCEGGKLCLKNSICDPLAHRCTEGRYTCSGCGEGNVCPDEGVACVPEEEAADEPFTGGPCADSGYCFNLPDCTYIDDWDLYGVWEEKADTSCTSHSTSGNTWTCCKREFYPGNPCGANGAGNCYSAARCSEVGDYEELVVAGTGTTCPSGWTCCQASTAAPTSVPTGTDIPARIPCNEEENGHCFETDDCVKVDDAVDYGIVDDTLGACVTGELCCKSFSGTGTSTSGTTPTGPGTTTPTTPPVCMNDCTAEGQRECLGESSYKECGKDANSCLKWTKTGNCQEFYKCDAGMCVVSCIDQDGDGYGQGPDCQGADCNDNDADINPGANEECDGIDNNCNSKIDDGTEQINSWDPCGKTNCCPEASDCLVDAAGNFGNNYKPEKYYTSQKPRCIADNQFIGDHLCQQGDWISRTGAIASQLIELATASGSENYSLFCGSYNQTLNNYAFLVGSEFVDETYILNCKINGVDVPCVNNFCVLEYEEGVVGGVSLNLPLSSKNFLEALKYTGNCNSAVSNKDGQFNPCSTKNVWFNAKHTSIIFSNEDTNLRPTNFLDMFIEFFENPIEALLDLLDLPTRAKAEITASNVYVLEGEKDVTATMESVCKADFESAIVVSYSGISTNLCEEIKDAFPGSCIEKDGKYYVLADDSAELFLYWNDLTAKLRIS